MMGGQGLTRWDGVLRRWTVDACRALTIRAVAPYLGAMPVHLRYTWADGATIDARLSDREMLALGYRVRRGVGRRMPVDQVVPLVWTACQYGGERPWYRCPACDRRVSALYLPPDADRFACRHCHDLAYPSQRMSENDRLLERSRAIQRRLGGDPARLLPWHVPPPKGMHLRTAARLADALDTNERHRIAAVSAGTERMMERWERHDRCAGG